MALEGYLMKPASERPAAPEIHVSTWLNTAEDITLSSLKGRVVVLEAFQMLCPGCVAHGLPQVKTVRALFSEEDVAVIGIHSVFEHHSANSKETLRAFLYENQLSFPVGIDQSDGDGLPHTMKAYQMRGTPSLILIDSEGCLNAHFFGHVSDMQLGAMIASLVNERG